MLNFCRDNQSNSLRYGSKPTITELQNQSNNTMGKNAKIAILKFPVVCFFTTSDCYKVIPYTFPIKCSRKTVSAATVIVVFQKNCSLYLILHLFYRGVTN